MIRGKLVGVFKNGKRYVDCENGKLYHLYSRVWVALKPLRPGVIYCRRVLNYLKRRTKEIFKKSQEETNG